MTGRVSVLGLIVCLLAGLWAGWALGEKGGQENTTGPGTKSKRLGGGSGRPAPPGGVLAKVGLVQAQEGTGRKLRSAYALAMSVPVERIEEWLEGDYFDTPDSRVDSFFYSILYDRYLDADPEAFLSRCVRKNYDDEVTARYMREWVGRDPAAAAEFLNGVRDQRDYEPLAAATLAKLADTDQEAAMLLLGDLSKRMGSSGWALLGAFGKLAEKDPDGLIQASRDWPSHWQDLAFQEASTAMLRQDYLAGIEWITEQSKSEGAFADPDLFGRRPEFGPKLLELADQLPEGLLDATMRSNSWSLVRKDPWSWLAADGEALGMSKSTIGTVRRSALSQIVSQDWDRAAALLDEGLLSDQEQSTLLNSLVTNVAYRNREKAQAWVDGLGNAELREAAQQELVNLGPRSSARLRPEPKDFVEKLASKNHHSVSTQGARYWTAAEVSVAVDEFAGLDVEDRRTAASRLISNSRYLPFALSGEAVRTMVENPPVREEEQGNAQVAAMNLASEWVTEDPAAAGRWVKSLPEGVARDQAVTTLLYSWRLQNPKEAERWAAGWDGVPAED